MTRIGIISDTHGYWDDKFLTYFEECDEIWHAGDICFFETMERLQAPFGNPARRRIVRAVCGRSATKESSSKNVAIDILKGTYSPEVMAKGYQNLKTFDAGREISGRDWRDYLLQMLQMGDRGAPLIRPKVAFLRSGDLAAFQFLAPHLSGIHSVT